MPKHYFRNKNSMKTLKVFFLLIISSVIIFAQEPAKKEEVKPIIEFESTVHDFGKIYQGKPAVCEFVFTNKGKVPLVLSNVQPGCGCTTPEWPREPIMPGQKAKIKAIYNPGSYKGQFGKGITVYSNATNGTIQLTIKGTVEEVPTEPHSPVKIDVGGGF
jgi:hypothetical protein